MDVAIAVVIAFFAGVGVGTFVVGSSIRKIVGEVLSASEKGYDTLNQKAESILAKLEARADAVKKAL